MNMTKEEFKKIRVEHGYTQKELAEYLGFTEAHISYMENGHKQVVKRTGMVMGNLPFNDARK